jgi:uncharacterized protein YkwD
MHRGLATLLALLVAAAWFAQPLGAAAAGTAPTSPATTSTATTSTAATMDSQILSSMNSDRANRKLVALRVDTRLAAWATDRAAWMASHAILTHTSYGGSPCNLFVIERITWYECGEAIADTTTTFGSNAASALYALWKGSPEHFALITSSTFNYVGVGVAYRAANHTTYGSILFLEGPEHNRPIPSWTSAYLNGRTVHWGWTAYDPRLQTHTAAIANYDVQMRVNHGSWFWLRTDSTAITATFRDRAPGTSWEIRIRARDTAGNTSVWLSSTTFTVP